MAQAGGQRPDGVRADPEGALAAAAADREGGADGRA